MSSHRGVRAVVSLLLLAVVYATCDFNSQGLTELPELSASTGCTVLDLSSNDITAIPAGAFDGLTSLEQLWLYSNQIANISAGAFNGLTSLKELHLYFNQVTAVPAGVFSNLLSLEQLYLFDNQIMNVSAGAFNGLTSLQGLQLNGNHITALPAGVFNGLTSLVELFLHSNQVAAVPAGLFDGLTLLQELRLYSNPITTVSAGAFDGLTSLQSLQLNSIEITDLPAGVFNGLTSLVELFLSDNLITALPAGVFDGLTSLVLLHLDSNRLTALPAGVFDGLTSLQRLKLNHNRLTALPAGVFNNLTSLQYLHLNSNEITALPASVFNNLTSLEWLVLNSNRITAVPAGVFSSLLSLDHLNLQVNLITAISAGAFEGLTSLGELRLNSNLISALPVGVFDSLASLHTLWLNSNQITAIPAGVFDGLTSLLQLRLNFNQITAIAAGAFDGLTSLRNLWLYDNLLWDNMFTNGTLLEATVYATPATDVQHDCIMSASTQTNSCTTNCDSSALAAFTRSTVRNSTSASSGSIPCTDPAVVHAFNTTCAAAYCVLDSFLVSHPAAVETKPAAVFTVACIADASIPCDEVEYFIGSASVPIVAGAGEPVLFPSLLPGHHEVSFRTRTFDFSPISDRVYSPLQSHSWVIAFVAVAAWDYPGVTSRTGMLPSAPQPGNTTTLVLTTGTNFTVLSADVNDVTPSHTHDGSTTHYLTFTTPPGGEAWPWTGLTLEAQLFDGIEMVSLQTTVIPGSTWSEESASRGMSGLASFSSRGVCMGDVDADGDVDVFAAMAAGAVNQLWVNDGVGVFVEEAGVWGVEGPGNELAGCGFGDADGDGLLDLMVTQATGDPPRSQLYMNAGGRYEEEGKSRGVVGTNQLGLSWGDVDGDGSVDVLVGAFTTSVTLLINDGAGVFADEAADRGLSGLTNMVRQTVLVDVDGDGALDGIVLQDGAANLLFMNGGNGSFVEEGTVRGFAGSTERAFAVAVLDVNGDGAIDVFVSNMGARDLLFVNDGGGVFVEVGTMWGLDAAVNSRTPIPVDLESDGDVDIVVCVWTGVDMVWVNDGFGTMGESALGLGLGSVESGWGGAGGDVDGDGDVDIVMGYSGKLYVNHNARSSGVSSVCVRPLGGGGGQSAFGAGVRVECIWGCSDAWQGMRVIDGGGGYYSQGGYDAVVGVPSREGVYNVSVRWAGDAFPAANWTTHPRLGGIEPSTLTLSTRLFVVRPWAVEVAFVVTPWEYASVGEPVAGGAHNITVLVSPGVNMWDVRGVSAVVRGQDVFGTWSSGYGGVFTVTYVTPGGEESWPWEVMDVEVVVEDSSGLVSSGSVSVVPGVTWSEESASRGMSGLASSSSQGVCMGDVDADGDVDVFVAMSGSAVNQLWVNDGVGVFVEEAGERGVGGEAGGGSTGCGFGDADGDGLLDLMVTHSEGGAIKLFMNAGGRYEEEGESRGVVDTNGLGLSWGDVDGDGSVDVLLGGHDTRPSILLINDGAGVFASVLLSNSSGATYQTALVDVDDDGDLDGIVPQFGAVNMLFMNDGSGDFVEDGVTRGFDADTFSRGVAVGDWSGDGAVDVYVSTNSAVDLLYVNQGSGVFLEVGASSGLATSTGTALAVASLDLEHDGDLDVIVGHYGGQDMVWANTGRDSFEEVSTRLALGSSGDSRAVSVGDLDGDGAPDVVVGVVGALFINHNADFGLASSLKVRPISLTGAQSVFGAAVRLVCVDGCATPWVGLRVIDGGSGFYSQNAYDAHFGVPVPHAAYNGSVRWPGDLRPESNWTTVPALGSIVPSFLTLDQRLIVVGHAVVIEAVAPWDYGATTDRVGLPVRAPVVNDTVTVVLSVQPPDDDLVAFSITVDGIEVGDTLVGIGGGRYNVTFTVGEDSLLWPWVGLDVDVKLSLPSTPQVVQAVGSASFLPHATMERREFGLTLDGAIVLCLGDVDGDGVVDVFVGSAAGQLWMWNGTRAEYVESGAAWGVPVMPEAATGCGFGDVDKDGLLDLHVALPTYRDVLLMNAGNSSFSLAGAALGLADRTAAGAGWGDVSGDGWLDLVVCGDGERPALYVGVGNGSLVESWEAWTSSPATCDGVAVADVVGGRHLDVVMVQISAPSAVLESVGGRLDDVGVVVPPGVAVSIFDVNSDGVLDVVIAGDAFTESGSVYGFRDASTVLDAAVVDVDGDGDEEVFVLTAAGFTVYINHNARPGIGNWLAVRTVTEAGAASAFGSTVSIECLDCLEPWSAVKVVGASSSAAQFGLPKPSTLFSVQVSFADSALHDASTQPFLAAVPAAATATVANRPYAVDAVATPSTGVINLAETVNITIQAALNRTGLLPSENASECCFVNGVQVRDSFVELGGGQYLLSYSPTLGDSEWPVNELSVSAPLQAAGMLPMLPIQWTPPGPAGDTVPPALSVDCRPPRDNSFTFASVCVSCPLEGVCTFAYTFAQGTLPSTPAAPASNMTTATSATIDVGPLTEQGTVGVDVWAIDAAGNPGVAEHLEWVRDSITPTSSFVGNPSNPSKESDVTFLLACDEPVCFYEYNFEGEGWTPVVGNVTGSEDGGGSSVEVETIALAVPPRDLNASSFGFVYSVTVDTATPNVTLEIVVDGEAAIVLPSGSGENVMVELSGLEDGGHTVSAQGFAGENGFDVSPEVYEFVVDTVPPRVEIYTHPADGTTASFEEVGFGADDDVVLYRWRAGSEADVEGLAWAETTDGALEVAGFEAGVRFVFQVAAVDRARNVGEVVEASWVRGRAPEVVVLDVRDLGASGRLVTFSAEGWDAFEYSMDGGGWTETSQTFIAVTGVTHGLPHVLRLRAVGSKAETVVEWHDEAVEPGAGDGVEILAAPPPLSTDVFAVFEFGVSHSGLSLEHLLSGDATWSPCLDVVELAPLPPGDHWLSVRAVDKDGVVFGVEARHEWRVEVSSGSNITLSVLSDGLHSVAVRGVDAAGNEDDTPASSVWRVDSTAPTTIASLTSPAVSTVRVVTLDVACVGEVDTCTFCWESVSVMAGCSFNSSLALPVPSEGNHTLAVWAVDSVGLRDEVPVNMSWFVDSVSPTTAVDVGGDAVFDVLHRDDVDFVSLAPAVNVSLAADEAVSEFAVMLDGSVVWRGVEEVVEVSIPDDNRVHNVSVAAVDVVGNTDPTQPSFRIMVDDEEPNTLVNVDAELVATDSFTVNVTSSDAASGVVRVEVEVNGVRQLDLSGSSGVVVVAGLESGVYNVSAAAVDGGGLIDGSPAGVTVVVDLIPPVVQFSTPPTLFTNSPNITIFTTTSEPGLTEAMLGGHSGWLPVDAVSGNVSFRGVADGTYTVALRATDVAGNTVPAPTVSDATVVDTVRPVVSIMHTDGIAEWSSASSVEMCVAAGDATPVAFSTSRGEVVSSNGMEACVAYNVTADGQQAIFVNGTDAAGNGGEAVSVAWGVDRVPPSTVLISDILALSLGCAGLDSTLVCPNATSASIHTVCDDGGVDVAPCTQQYAVSALEVVDEDVCARRLQAAPPTDAPTTPFTLPVPGGNDGWYQVVLLAVDAAGNVEASNTTLDWHVDSTPPMTPTLPRTPLSITSQSQAFFDVQLAGDTSPGQTTLMYSLNGGLPTQVPTLPPASDAVVSFVIPEALPDGEHGIEVWGVDQLGRSGPSTLYDWVVANEAPVVELVEAPAAFSGDSTPFFVVRAVWPHGYLRNGTEPLAVIQVDEGEGFQALCDGTSSAGGLCVWNLALAEPLLKTVAFRAVFGEENGVGLTHTWRYTLCDDSHYAVIGDNFAITCEPCPSGGDCAGGLTQLDNIVVAEGFWTPPDAIIFYECPLDGACIPGGSVTIGNTTSFSRHRCAAGHVGTLCAVCDDGYFQQFGRCVKCGSSKGVAWVITLVLVLVVAGVGTLFFRFKEVLPVDQLKVALSFLQIIASANTAYSIPWPPVFVGFLDAARVFLVEVVSLTRANCAQPMSYYSSLTVTLVGFKVITVAIVVGPVLVTKWKARRAAPPASTHRVHRHQHRLSRRLSLVLTAAIAKAAQVDWSKVFKVAFLFLFVAYPSVSLKIMLLFKCVEVEGVPWLDVDMRLECYTGEWYGYALYAVIMGVMYTVGLPLVIAGILWKNRKRLQEAATLKRWGFLYEVYGAGAYMWEVEELVRKLILSALVVLVNDGNPLQISLAVFVSGWAHVLHSMYKPWRGAGVDGDYTYVLQHMTLFVTAFVFLMGLLFKVEGVAQGTPTFDALAWILLLLCVGAVLAAVVLLVHSTGFKMRVVRDAKLLGASAEFDADESTASVRMTPNLTWTSNPLKARRK